MLEDQERQRKNKQDDFTNQQSFSKKRKIQKEHPSCVSRERMRPQKINLLFRIQLNFQKLYYRLLLTLKNQKLKESEWPSLSGESGNHNRCFFLQQNNVSSFRHEVMWRMLDRVNQEILTNLCSWFYKQVPNTRLGRLARASSHEEISAVCKGYDFQKNELIFLKSILSYFF